MRRPSLRATNFQLRSLSPRDRPLVIWRDYLHRGQLDAAVDRMPGMAASCNLRSCGEHAWRAMAVHWRNQGQPERRDCLTLAGSHNRRDSRKERDDGYRENEA